MKNKKTTGMMEEPREMNKTTSKVIRNNSHNNKK